MVFLARPKSAATAATKSNANIIFILYLEQKTKLNNQPQCAIVCYNGYRIDDFGQLRETSKRTLRRPCGSALFYSRLSYVREDAIGWTSEWFSTRRNDLGPVPVRWRKKRRLQWESNSNFTPRMEYLIFTMDSASIIFGIATSFYWADIASDKKNVAA